MLSTHFARRALSSTSPLLQALGTWSVARRHDDALAARNGYGDRAGVEVRWTYAELAKHVQAYANGFKQAGVREGDRIVLGIDSSAEFLTTMLALSAIGAVPVAASAQSSPRGLSRLLRGTRSHGFVFDDSTVFGQPFLHWIDHLFPETKDMWQGEYIRSSEYPMLKHLISTSSSKDTPPGVSLLRFHAAYGAEPLSADSGSDGVIIAEGLPCDEAVAGIDDATGTAIGASDHFGTVTGTAVTQSKLLGDADKLGKSLSLSRGDPVAILGSPLENPIGYAASMLAAFTAGATVVLPPNASASGSAASGKDFKKVSELLSAVHGESCSAVIAVSEKSAQWVETSAAGEIATDVVKKAAVVGGSAKGIAGVVGAKDTVTITISSDGSVKAQ